MNRHHSDLDRYIEISSRLGEGEDLAAQRKAYSGSSAELGLAMPNGVQCVDEEMETGGHRVRLRRYRPDRLSTAALVVYFHGGGWVKGDLESHHEVVAHLALGFGAQTVAVDYPLAPENRHPVQLNCGHAVLERLRRQLDQKRQRATRLVVVGDSAGGQVAAALCMLARDRGGPTIAAQILIYPVLSERCDTDSYRRFGDGPPLTRDAMHAYWNCFLPEAGAVEPLSSPLLEDRVDDLPPAIIQLAEVDVLRDEAVAYAERLAAQGTPVEILTGNGLIHGFLRAIGLSHTAREEFDRLCVSGRDLIASL